MATQRQSLLLAHGLLAQDLATQCCVPSHEPGSTIRNQQYYTGPEHKIARPRPEKESKSSSMMHFKSKVLLNPRLEEGRQRKSEYEEFLNPRRRPPKSSAMASNTPDLPSDRSSTPTQAQLSSHPPSDPGSDRTPTQVQFAPNPLDQPAAPSHQSTAPNPQPPAPIHQQAPPHPRPIRPAFDAKVFPTSHAPVLIWPTVFTPSPDHRALHLIPDWPSRAEQRYEGDERIATELIHRRALPLLRRRDEEPGYWTTFQGRYSGRGGRRAGRAGKWSGPNPATPWMARGALRPLPFDDFGQPCPSEMDVFLRTHWVEELEVDDREGVRVLGRGLWEGVIGERVDWEAEENEEGWEAS